MGTSWISRKGGNLRKGGWGMIPLTNYETFKLGWMIMHLLQGYL